MLKNSAAAQLNSARTERRGVCQRIAEAKVLSRVHVEWRLEVGSTGMFEIGRNRHSRGTLQCSRKSR
jgi:hypothetical protein